LKGINKILNRNKSDNSLIEASSLQKLYEVSHNISLLFEHLCVDNISLAFYEIRNDHEEIKIFTDNEFMFMEILEAAYHMSRKLIFLITGNEALNFENISSYIYDSEPSFNIFENAEYKHSIYSPSWLAYVAYEVIAREDGGNVAAED
ncbi:hypothetical protein, partial [Kluyvera georgiana]|uniref:hypothetical protein n=1 Tax=Kluyvera georgiana TaxID=73098 RepID=UPI003AF11EC6